MNFVNRRSEKKEPQRKPTVVKLFEYQAVHHTHRRHSRPSRYTNAVREGETIFRRDIVQEHTPPVCPSSSGYRLTSSPKTSSTSCANRWLESADNFARASLRFSGMSSRTGRLGTARVASSQRRAVQRAMWQWPRHTHAPAPAQPLFRRRSSSYTSMRSSANCWCVILASVCRIDFPAPEQRDTARTSACKLQQVSYVLDTLTPGAQ